MKTFAAISLTAALLGATAVSPSTAQAAPVGAMAGVFEAGAPAVDSVRYHGRGGRHRGGGNGAALAVGLIGAAVIGGALIAESRRREGRAYYYDDGYYDDGYYPAPAYVAPRRRYVGPSYYYAPPAYGYYPRHHNNHRYYHGRLVRDPAGGGLMRVP